MKNETEDIVYRCKDCSKYNLCCYYYRRKETSQICHYFELTERKTGKWIDHSEDGYAECPLCGHLTTCEGNIEDLHYCFWCGARLTAADPCDNDCEHCDWATCPKEEGKE